MVVMKHYIRFDDMTWPLPDGDLAWRLTWGDNPSRGDILRAASVIVAYGELVRCHAATRRRVVRELRRAAAERGTAVMEEDQKP